MTSVQLGGGDYACVDGATRALTVSVFAVRSIEMEDVARDVGTLLGDVRRSNLISGQPSALDGKCYVFFFQPYSQRAREEKRSLHPRLCWMLRTNPTSQLLRRRKGAGAV